MTAFISGHQTWRSRYATTLLPIRQESKKIKSILEFQNYIYAELPNNYLRSLHVYDLLMLYFPLYYLLFFLLLRQYTLHKIVLLLIRGHLTQMPSTKIMAMYSKGPVNFAGPLTYQRSTNSLQFLSIIQTPKRLCVDLKCSPGNQV